MTKVDHVAPHAAPSESRPKRSTREVLSYLAVGGVGFVIEAVIITSLTRFMHWSPLIARIPSFLTAVLVTWALNRRLTFAERGLERRSVEAFFYTAIQGGGAVVNLGIFAATLALLPQLERVPVIPLAVGAVGGFAFNYLLSSKLLYSRFRTSSRG